MIFALGRSWAVLGDLGRSWVVLGRSWVALGRSWNALGSLLGRSWSALGAHLAELKKVKPILDPPRVDFGLSEEFPELLQEASEQPKRTSANLPKVDRKMSKNWPRRFRKPNLPALHSQLPLPTDQETQGWRFSRSELNEMKMHLWISFARSEFVTVANIDTALC